MQKIRIHKDEQATILCHACGRWKKMDAGVFFRLYRPLRVSCPCGAAFQVIASSDRLTGSKRVYRARMAKRVRRLKHAKRTSKMSRKAALPYTLPTLTICR